jgi:DNA-binding CsgD family transcriptional regulator
VGQPINRILRDPQLAAFWSDASRQDGTVLGEVSLRWPARLELKLNSTQCYDQGGTAIGHALLFCDVTDERTVQLQLSHAVASRLLDLTGDDSPAAEPLASLTRQELRILRLVGQGLGNEEIAAKAEISPSTVRSHLKNLYRKLSLGSRAEAVSYAVHNRLA